MLTIKIPASEQFNELTNEFIVTKEVSLQLEHSLISISKWESKWNKPFLINTRRSYEEGIDYVRCMTLNSNVDPLVYNSLTQENMDQINAYIDAPMTATTIHQTKQQKTSKEVYTSELLYYYMISYGIPFECQKWHLNRLLTLISICGVKNQTDNKMSRKDTLSQYAALNAARRQKLNSKG